MKKRKITNIYKVDFLPFDRYGPVVPKMSWHKISFDEKTGFGSLFSRWILVQEVLHTLILVMKSF